MKFPVVMYDREEVMAVDGERGTTSSPPSVKDQHMGSELSLFKGTLLTILLIRFPSSFMGINDKF